MIARMQPELLREYQILVQKSLQTQLHALDKNYPKSAFQIKQLYRNQELQGLYLVTKEQKQVKQEAQDQIEIDELRLHIIKYNQSKREQSKDRSVRKNQSKLQSSLNRKRRTTITSQKLDQMNKAFKQYIEMQGKAKIKIQQYSGQEEPQNQQCIPSLKDLGRQLGLGYSTILHKFRQFRNTSRVKPGQLIASKFKKRKYKKSIELQDLLKTCLEQKVFYSATEISKYIQQKHNKIYSRAIISRHLTEMGYSCKELCGKTKCIQEIKSIRKKYAVAFQTANSKPNSELYYLDQHVFEFIPHKWNDKEIVMQDEQKKQVHIIVLASKQGIINYNITSSNLDQSQFNKFTQEMRNYFEQRSDNPKILVMDLDKNLHYNQHTLQTRKQLKKKNLQIFYLPPNSNQMSLLQWFFMQMKQKLQQRRFSNFLQFQYTIDKMLRSVGQQNLQKYHEKAMNYVQLSLQNKKF